MRKKRVRKNSASTAVSHAETGSQVCKNCSTEIEGQFCHFCGQRYHDHKESFGELAYEFVSDFLHFDSRFFRTVLPLIFQPGKLTKNYNEGKQRSQFHPIRLYLFSSFIYFFLFFYFTNLEDKFEGETNKNSSAFIVDSVKKSIRIDSLTSETIDKLNLPEKNKILTSTPNVNTDPDKREFVTLQDSNTKYAFTVNVKLDSLLQKRTTPEQYLNQQKMLPKEKRDGYLERIITIRILTINLKGEEGKKEFFKKLTETFLHNIPKMLFFLLPLYAFFLKLLYFRKKQFYYVDHAILSLHYFSLIFILLIISKYVLDAIFGTAIFTSLAFIWISVYMLIAMKRLYGERWGRTIFKFLTLGFLLMFAIIFTLIVNMALTAFMI